MVIEDSSSLISRSKGNAFAPTTIAPPASPQIHPATNSIRPFRHAEIQTNQHFSPLTVSNDGPEQLLTGSSEAESVNTSNSVNTHKGLGSSLPHPDAQHEPLASEPHTLSGKQTNKAKVERDSTRRQEDPWDYDDRVFTQALLEELFSPPWLLASKPQPVLGDHPSQDNTQIIQDPQRKKISINPRPWSEYRPWKLDNSFKQDCDEPTPNMIRSSQEAVHDEQLESILLDGLDFLRPIDYGTRSLRRWIPTRVERGSSESLPDTIGDALHNDRLKKVVLDGIAALKSPGDMKYESGKSDMQQGISSVKLTGRLRRLWGRLSLFKLKDRKAFK